MNILQYHLNLPFFAGDSTATWLRRLHALVKSVGKTKAHNEMHAK